MLHNKLIWLNNLYFFLKIIETKIQLKELNFGFNSLPENLTICKELNNLASVTADSIFIFLFTEWLPLVLLVCYKLPLVKLVLPIALQTMRFYRCPYI
jgi:hypothetical protein